MVDLCHPHQVSEETDWEAEYTHIGSIDDHDPVLDKVPSVTLLSYQSEDPVNSRVEIRILQFFTESVL